MKIYKILKNTVLSILTIVITSTAAFAALETSSIFDEEKAARIDSQIQVSMKCAYLNRLSSDDETHEVFINEENIVDFRKCYDKDSSEISCTPLSSLRNQYNEKTECEKMKRDEDKLPKNTYFVCGHNKYYLMAVYKDEKENVIRVVGRNKDDKEFKIIKEISGKSIIPIYYAYSRYESGFSVFAISEEEASYDPKQGTSLIGINREDGSIVEYHQPFLLKARPVISEDRSVYFVGLDQNVYKIKAFSTNGICGCGHDEFGVGMVWENKKGLEVIGLGLSNRHSFIKLRDYGKDVYKFFSDDFGCELSTENDILDFRYLDSSEIMDEGSNAQSDRAYRDSVALVIRGDGYLPPSIFIERWYVDKSNQRFKVKPVSNAATLMYDAANSIRELLNILDSDSDADHKKLNLSSENRCKLTNRFDEDFKKTKVQRKLFKDLSVDYRDVEFVRPYSITIKSSENDIQIPVNVWPAKGASAESPKPIIIYIHGGPSLYFDITDPHYYATMQYLAGQGYWVVCPETRGSSGYGDEHETALVNHWGQNHIDDIITVADVFKVRPDVDPHNVFLMGHSFGGYTTLATSTRPDVADYFDGYVSISGVSEVGKLLREAAELEVDPIEKLKYLNNWEREIGFAAYTNHSINSKNIEISPLYRTSNLNRPLMLIHGRNDTTVLPNQSESFFWRAKDSDKRIAAIMVEGQHHQNSIYDAAFSVKFFNEIVARKCPSTLSTNMPVYIDMYGVKKLVGH